MIADTPVTNDQINKCFCNGLVKTKVKRIMRDLARGVGEYDTAWLETQVDLTQLPRMYKRLNETEREAVDLAVKFSVFSECAYGALVGACGVSV